MPYAHAAPYGETLIDQIPGWRLYHRGSKYQIFLRQAGRKAYRLTWNRKRLALGRDARILLEHHPDVFAWVQTTCHTHTK